MDAFVTRTCRKRKPSPELATLANETHEESTDIKLAILSSLHPGIEQETLLDILLAHDGNVEETSAALKTRHITTKKPPGAITSQTSLRSFAIDSPDSPPPSKKTKTHGKKGQTLHLYDAKDMAEHTPCSIIHNFLPSEEANALLLELLEESKTFEKTTFKLFDNVVSSPHTSGFYVGSARELQEQKDEYVYNGARLADVRTLTPQLERVRSRVQEVVNREIQARIQSHQNGKKLKYQSPSPWTPNAALVNCYNGPQESVGWHTDQLTYLGPGPVIASLSLGVTREFRVRRILPPPPLPSSSSSSLENKDDAEGGEETTGKLGPQISLHLPHNSLLVMHSAMQENWKHSISPTASITPHPLAGSKRINITYRHYKNRFHPRFTPKCSGCDVPCVLRVVTKKKENWGKYFWMCHAGNVPGKQGCDYFKWAEFDDDGNPIQPPPGS
ncbi:alpha-ketoglutarate-dependent dioxygenase alkB 3 [Cladorrhinum sp. PSN332]|nr:alpha-ketoglutarate-dependent dioxygenase alkB 3 [Cladorrhinum sp. PSN332]